MNHEEVPDFVPDGLLDEPAPAEGFSEVTCGVCGCPVVVPVGPDFWGKAVFGISKCLYPFRMPLRNRDYSYMALTMTGPLAMHLGMGYYPPETDPPEEPA